MRKVWYIEEGLTKGFWEKFFGNEEIIKKHIRKMRSDVILPLILSKVNKNSKVLDAGCGPMVWAPLIVKKDACYIGMDTNKKLLEIGHAINEVISLNTTVGNVLNLPLKDSFFDLYLSLGVLEHLKEGIEAALLECVRVLKPGGYACIGVPYLNHIRRLLLPLECFNPQRLKRWNFLRKILGKRPVPKLLFYQYAYSLLEFRRLITSAGMVIEDIQAYDWEYGLTRDHRYIRKASKIFPKLFNKFIKILNTISPFVCAHLIIIVARKSFDK